MNYVRVMCSSLFGLSLFCVASFILQSKKLIKIPRSPFLTVSAGGVQRVKCYTDNSSRTPQTMVTCTSNASVATKSLFSTFRLNELEMLRPLTVPRPFFKFKMFPTVRRQPPEYLKQQDIKWSMVAAIKSSFKRREQRQAIRESWGRIRYLNGVRMHVIFVVALTETPEEGRILRNESEKFGDILQVELNETYRGIGLKALSAMQWVGDNFPNDWLYFSGDDDMLPNMDKLVRNMQVMIDEAKNIGRVEDSLPIHCAFHQARTPFVHRAGKWIVTKAEYPFGHYPPICLGGFYGMSIKLSDAIYNASRYYPYFRHDDVFITGFMRLVACDLPEDVFHFNRTDGFCALSKIQNSGFQHIHLHPGLYKLHWFALEEEMETDGAKIIREPNNVNIVTVNPRPQLQESQRDELVTSKSE